MQTAHVKYLKCNQNDICLFFHELNTLYYKILNPSGWSQVQTLASNVTPSFSVSEYEGNSYVLYSTMDGSVILAKTTNFAQWEHKQLMVGKRDFARTKFFMIPNQSTFHMIYHLPTESTGVQSLVYASFQDGKWEKPYKIDRFIPFGTTPFFANRIKHHHIILYYRTARNVISAREMLLSPYTLGSVNPVIQTPSPCTDISILNNSERIHLLYIVKGMFRSQVVYQYKQATSISTPRVLWEDNNCENCLVFQAENKLHFMWTVNNQPYHCISTNNGGSFEAVEKYTADFPKQCIKGELILSDKNQTFEATELYGDRRNQFQPFFFEKSQQKEIEIQEEEKAFSTPNISATEYHKNPSVYPNQNNAQMFEADNNFFKNAMSFQKDAPMRNIDQSQQQQIEELSNLLSQRAEEMAQVNAKWNEQVKRLEKELNTIKKNYTSLNKENETLKQTISILEQKNSTAISAAEQEAEPSPSDAEE